MGENLRGESGCEFFGAVVGVVEGRGLGGGGVEWLGLSWVGG